MGDLAKELRERLRGRVCLVGIGNPDLGDDGFGVRLAEVMRAAGHPDVVVAGTTPERWAARLAEEGFDTPFGAPTGSGDIFAASGGVMESALRSAYFLITGKDLEKLEFEQVRGMAGVKEASVDVGGKTIRVAIANRLSNARLIAERVKAGDSPWDFIEVMACPGGCAGGGGQLFG